MEAYGGPLAGWRARAEGAMASIPLVAAVIAVATIAVGLWVHESGTTLGAPLPPFNANWDPDVSPYALIAVALLTVAVMAGPVLLSRPGSPLAFAGAVFGLGLAVRLALGAARDGPERWSAVFGSDGQAQNEYLPALAALDPGVGTFLDRFAEVALTLPIHPSAHPPGVLLTLHWLGIDGAGGATVLAILVGGLTIPLTYLLARQLVDERRARTATLLVLLAPASLLYGVTSFDALFAGLGTAAAALLVSRHRLARAAGGPALALASFFSFALLAVGAWAVLVTALRRGVGAALRLALWAGSVTLGAYLALYAFTGFDPIGAIQAASQAYELGISRARPYGYWLFGSPVAFGVAIGLPLAWYALRALARRDPTATALAVVVAISAVLGYTKAETERIWLFMLPLAAVAAVTALPQRRVQPVRCALAVQALAVELLFWTVW
jgi:hypothetical protein